MEQKLRILSLERSGSVGPKSDRLRLHSVLVFAKTKKK